MADGGVVDVGGSAAVEPALLEGGDAVVLGAGQVEDGLDPARIHLLAHQVEAVAVQVGSGDDGAGKVVHEEPGIDGVQAVDVFQDAGHGLGLRLAGTAGGHAAAQGRGEGPPAAVVGPLVEVAVHDVDHQAGDELHVLQAGGDGGLVEVGDGAGEEVAGAVAGLGNLLQHGFELEQVTPLVGSHDLAVPHHPAQGKVDALGAPGDVGQGRAEGVGMGQHALQHLRRQALGGLAQAGAEGGADRHHDMAHPAGPDVALVAPGGAGPGQVFAAAPIDDAVIRIPHLLQAAAQGHVVGIAGGDHRALGVQQQHHRTVLPATQVAEDALRLVGKAEAQAQHPQGLAAVAVVDALGVDEGPLQTGAQVAGAEGLHIAVGVQGLLQQGVLGEEHGAGAVQVGDDPAVEVQ
ncbi:MAG: hypothetical protein DI538_30075, partial [Azospira oryzae]